MSIPVPVTDVTLGQTESPAANNGHAMAATPAGAGAPSMDENLRHTQKVLRDIEVLIRARYPIIYIVTYEEQRVVHWLTSVALKRKKRMFEWSLSSGLNETGTPVNPQKVKSSPTRDPVQAMDELIAHVEPAIYVFKDLHQFLHMRCQSNAGPIRKLRETGIHIRDTYKSMILVSPVLEVPPELEKEITVVDFPLPDEADLGLLLDRILDEVRLQPSVTIDISPQSREGLLKAALGLTLGEAENVLAKTLVSDNRLSDEDIDGVFAEKRQIVRKSGLLDYCEVDLDFEKIGGMDTLKSWLRMRGAALSDRAREFGLPVPRGVLLLGVQGCGKTMCAKAISAAWRMPLLRLDMGRMFGSLVGSSEANMRRALSTAESIAPVVLWLDEIDKALAGSRGGGGDSGVTARLFGTFLTWMSEKQSPVFVVATANDISALPPELLRKGRFDEIFFVDLPTPIERKEIFRVRLQFRQRNPDDFALDMLAELADGFSGAEIEEAVVSGLYEAFAAGEELRDEHIASAISSTVPLSKTMQHELDQLRGWADGRTRPASVNHVAEAAKPRRRIEIN